MNNNSTSVVNVEFQELANTERELSALSAEMKAITERMAQMIEDIKNVWQDENGKTFASRFETEVQSKFKNYYGTVQEYSDFISNAYKAYLAHDSATKTAVQSRG